MIAKGPGGVKGDQRQGASQAETPCFGPGGDTVDPDRSGTEVQTGFGDRPTFAPGLPHKGLLSGPAQTQGRHQGGVLADELLRNVPAPGGKLVESAGIALIRDFADFNALGYLRNFGQAGEASGHAVDGFHILQAVRVNREGRSAGREEGWTIHMKSTPWP